MWSQILASQKKPCVFSRESSTADSLLLLKLFQANPIHITRKNVTSNDLPGFYFVSFCVEKLSTPSKRIGGTQNHLLHFKDTIEISMEQK